MGVSVWATPCVNTATEAMTRGTTSTTYAHISGVGRAGKPNEQGATDKREKGERGTGEVKRDRRLINQKREETQRLGHKPNRRPNHHKLDKGEGGETSTNTLQ